VNLLQKRWGVIVLKKGRRGSRGTAASASRGTSTRRSLYGHPTQPCKCILPLSCQFQLITIFAVAFQYACRKTLADSRPRVQGRFARNVEADGDVATDMETEASDISYEYSSCNDLSGGNCYDSQSQCREAGGDSMVFDDNKWWWWATPVAADRQPPPLQQSIGFDVSVDDEDQLWASLVDMCSGT
jgi:hypothetical protein